MGNEKVLRERRKEALDKADAIVALAETEQRGITADEKKDFDAHMVEVKRIEEELESAHRAKAAKDELEARKRYDVPDVARATPETEGEQTQHAEVRENEHRAYQKGDALGAILAARMRYGAHEQQKAIREAERLYGSGSPHVRAMQQSSFTSGGALIPENFVGAEFIELLRPESAFRKAGARVVQLVNGSFTTPRLTGGVSGDWVGSEGDNLTTGEATLGQLKLVEKKYGVVVPFSNDLRRNASLDAIRIVREDLLRAVANDEDAVFLNGSGLLGRPKGVYNWIPAANKANTAGTALANVRTDIRRMKNGLDSANVPYIRRAFLMHSRTMNYMGWDLVDGNSNFAFPSLQSAGGAVLGGDPVYRDNNISIALGGTTNSEIYYVEMTECYIGDSMEMEFDIIENAVYSQSGTLRSGVSRDESVLRLIRKTDFGMRHTASAFIIEAIAYGA
jgi:HK97 family phage major capsid protein